MPLYIVLNDITKMEVDAIVNAANNTLLGGGGVDGCIHRAAGPRLLEKCRKLGGCETGDAKITRGYELPAKYIIHTVGPIWQGGGNGEKELLTSCYRRSLEIARQHFCKSVAFPLISAGVYGYPKDQVLRVAVDTVKEFLAEHDMTVYLVIYQRKDFQLGEDLCRKIQSYIEANYAPEVPEEEEQWHKDGYPPMSKRRLESMVAAIREGFTEMLVRKLGETGMTNAECYRQANIDKKLFHTIRKDTFYRPTKPQVIAFAAALKLSMAEMKDMLLKSGFWLSKADKFDLIVEYFLTSGVYDVHEINLALFQFEQSLLGE